MIRVDEISFADRIKELQKNKDFNLSEYLCSEVVKDLLDKKCEISNMARYNNKVLIEFCYKE